MFFNGKFYQTLGEPVDEVLVREQQEPIFLQLEELKDEFLINSHYTRFAPSQIFSHLIEMTEEKGHECFISDSTWKLTVSLKEKPT